MTDCRVSEAAAAVGAKIGAALGGQTPRAAIILGSGLDGFAGRIENSRSVSFTDIPHFVPSTADGHRGEIVAGHFDTGSGLLPVVVLAGRLHRYEGWSATEVGFPVAVTAALGAEVLIVSNAAGGLNRHFRVGDLMVLCDHINLMATPAGDPQLGWSEPAAGRSGPLAAGGDIAGDLYAGDLYAGDLYAGRCRTSATHYDPELAAVAIAAARRANFAACLGTYLATLGPNYETRAEYRMMRRIGADAVGMSTVPEVLEARRQGMRVLAISMISNLAFSQVLQPCDHQHVLEAGQRAEPKLRHIIQAVLSTLA